jgi:hypothetical protein
MDLDSQYRTECASIVLGNRTILILGIESGRVMICAAGTGQGYSAVLASRVEPHPYQRVPMIVLSDDLELHVSIRQGFRKISDSTFGDAAVGAVLIELFVYCGKAFRVVVYRAEPRDSR